MAGGAAVPFWRLCVMMLCIWARVSGCIIANAIRMYDNVVMGQWYRRRHQPVGLEFESTEWRIHFLARHLNLDSPADQEALQLDYLGCRR